ncbi:YHS domain-containing (seleno)protein [Enterovirga sp.]|jgi:YHS domain-containing protein|uniref:YHS domain-containing (seleno)protein n=1 Tax=Enterovirga sp. TaxID=2026350 RepID=UPI00262AEE72|nr:YHS domain-containing (seleno)protein [Enterovirga sp.]MDB5591071.1 hypothetical protein [Enterovirga sp.]
MSLFRISAAALLLGFATPALAGRLPVVLGATEVFASDALSGVALSGFDPVAYVIEGQPVPGLAQHEAVFAGLAWRFSSAANRAAFLRRPEAFLPRAGGYDALAAAAGRLVTPDPFLFAIRQGRLYFFRTAENRRRFLDDEGAAGAAERGWNRVRARLVQS